MEMLIQLGILAIGFVMLVKGSDWFVDGASSIATKFGIPQLVIGLTIVALGISLPELFTSALEGDGVEDFKEILQGKTSVLCGSSGVGKSSLINAICPGINIKTKEVSEKTLRGTHTTRHCEIINIDEDTRIVDTPGFSNLKFDFLLPNEVDSLFDEIYKYKGLCKFPDCLHLSETGCAIKAHLDSIDETRYASYREFVEEAREYKEKVKYQGIKTETSHKKINERTAAKISSRKRQNSRNTIKQNVYKDIENERLD